MRVGHCALVTDRALCACAPTVTKSGQDGCAFGARQGPRQLGQHDSMVFSAAMAPLLA